MGLMHKTLTLLRGEVAARVLGILLFAVLARAVSIDDFGTLNFAMNAAMMAGVFVDMGQNAHLGRLIARESDQANHVIGEMITNKAVLGVVAVVVMSGGLGVAGFAPDEVGIAALMCVWATLLSMLDGLRAAIRAQGRMSADSTVNALESLGRLAAVVGAWAVGASLVAYGYAYILEALIALTAFALYFRRNGFGRLGLGTIRGGFGLLRESWLLGVSSLVMAGFYRIDQVLVQGLAGAGENALYGAAARVAFTATVGGSLVMMAAYPDLARAAARRSLYGGVLKRVVVMTIGVGAAAAVFVALAAKPILGVLYGAEYAAAAPVLRVLSCVILANGLTIVGVYSANALGLEKRTVVIAACIMLMSIAGNSVLIPAYGAMGAAWVSVAGESLLAVALLAVSAFHLLEKREPEGAAADAHR